MNKEYTRNQTIAFATLLTGVMWTLVTYSAGLMVGIDEPWYIVIATPIAFTLAILYLIAPLKPNLKWVYIVGIILCVDGIITVNTYSYMPFRPTPAPPWFMFEQPLFHSTFGLFLLICIICAYYSYKSYIDLKKQSL